MDVPVPALPEMYVKRTSKGIDFSKALTPDIEICLEGYETPVSPTRIAPRASTSPMRMPRTRGKSEDLSPKRQPILPRTSCPWPLNQADPQAISPRPLKPTAATHPRLLVSPFLHPRSIPTPSPSTGPDGTQSKSTIRAIMGIDLGRPKTSQGSWKMDWISCGCRRSYRTGRRAGRRLISGGACFRTAQSMRRAVSYLPLWQYTS